MQIQTLKNQNQKDAENLSAIYSLCSCDIFTMYDNSPAPEAFANVQKAVNEFKKTAFHNGLNDVKTQKAIDNVDKAVKNASFYNTETHKYEVPPAVAELMDAGKVIRRNPESGEAQELIEKYSGVGNTKVERNEALKQLIKDKKI